MKKILTLICCASLTACVDRPVIYCVEGVAYVATSASYRAGITPLLDLNGKPKACKKENA